MQQTLSLMFALDVTGSLVTIPSRYVIGGSVFEITLTVSNEPGPAVDATSDVITVANSTDPILTHGGDHVDVTETTQSQRYVHSRATDSQSLVCVD